MRTHPKPTLVLSALVALTACSTSLLFAAEPEIKLPLPNWKPAVRGALPDGPKFHPNRPKPAINPQTGQMENVLDPETMLTPPNDTFTLQRRNNFYKKPELRDPNGDAGGLYRFAASGHFTNYSEVGNEQWRATVPDPLKMLNGEMVKDAETWRKVRRPEIIRIMEFYMFGKVPDTVPEVVWTAGEPTQGVTNGIATITRTATGRFVNKDGTPWVNPNPPAGGGRGRGAPGGPTPAGPGGPGALADSEPFWNTAFGGGGRAGGGARGPGGAGGGGLTVTYTIPANTGHRVPVVRGGNLAQLLPAGLGVVSFGGGAPDVRSNPPADDDWGAIRKSAWVVSKGLDYLETDPYADAQTAVTGHSIGGKQALMAAVFDERVSVCFASCSGLGGAQMARHDWGETIDDVAQLSPQNYCNNLQYWVSRYNDMPFDAHFLLALMAPRALLVSGGSTDQWSDPVGVFWAAYYAAPVYKLLGAKAFDDTKPPAQNTFIGENLVFYHHIGGHITTPEETAQYIEMQKKFMKPSPLGSEKKPAAK